MEIWYNRELNWYLYLYRTDYKDGYPESYYADVLESNGGESSHFIKVAQRIENKEELIKDGWVLKEKGFK